MMHNHLGTVRLAAVVRVGDFASPVGIKGGQYIFLIASEKQTAALALM
jgi:hypothetical protein